MNLGDWAAAMALGIGAAWVAVVIAVAVGDRRHRRDAAADADARLWRAKVDAMRRMANQDDDLRGDA